MKLNDIVNGVSNDSESLNYKSFKEIMRLKKTW